MKDQLRSSAFVKKDDDGSITYTFTVLIVKNGLATDYQILKNERGQTRVYSSTFATNKDSMDDHINTLREREKAAIKAGYIRISEKDKAEIENLTSSNRIDEIFMRAELYLPHDSKSIIQQQAVPAEKIKLLKKITVKPRGPR